MKQPTTLLLFAAMITICSCGGSSKKMTPRPVQTLAAGNWLLQEDTLVSHTTGFAVKLGGELTTTAATMLPIFSSNCFPSQKPTAAPLTFSVKTSGNTINLTWAPTDQTTTVTQTMVVTADLNPGNNFVGTYTESGNGTNNCVADNGTVYGTLVPSLTGKWSGTLPGVTGNQNTHAFDPTAVTASFTQSDTLSSDLNNNTTLDTFPLSGTITISNPCLASGTASLTIDTTASYVIGDKVAITTAAAADGTVLSLNPAQAPSLTDPTTAIALTFGTFTVSGGPCNGYGGQSPAGGAPSTQVTLNKS